MGRSWMVESSWSHTCNQCEFVFHQAAHLKSHMIESITECQDCYSHWTWFGFPPLRPPSLVGFPACGWLSSSRDPQTLHFRHSPLTSTASHRSGEKRKEMQHRVWICRKLSSRLSHNEDSCFEEAVTRVREEKNTKNWYTIDALDAIFTILDTFAILLQ